MLSRAGAHGEHPQPRTEGQSGALRSCSLSLQYHSNFCNLLIQKLGFCNVITRKCGSQDLQHLCVYLLGQLMLFPCGFSWAAAGTGEEESLRNTKA